MSKTLDFIKSHNIGYKVLEYEDNERKSLKDVLNLELLDLGNIDIPYYLNKENLIDLSIYNVTDIEFESMRNEFYLTWLKVNELNDNQESLITFKIDCNMKKHQCYIKNIITDIIIGVEEELDCKSNNIIAIWLNSQAENDNIIYTIPKQYIVLSDMDELGVLIAYNNNFQ